MNKTMTLSFKTNPRKTNIRHNNRELTEKEFNSDAHKHIQREKSKYNIQIFKRDIKDVYHELFDDALNAYNTKQKRKDRKIDDYYKHVQKSKNLDLQREFIVAVGNKADWERLIFEEKQEAGEALKRYVIDFNERHDNMTIYNAIVHLDESGAPHAHFNVVPTATGYKNGLAVQPSFRKALEQEGFGPSGREQLKAFRDAEVHRLHEFVHEIGIDRKAGQTNDIKDMREYKDAMEYIENRKSNQIVKMQREEKAHEEKMHELDERLRKQEEMIRKRDEAFKASKRKQARIIKEYNDEIVSKSEELDLEMIKDDTVDAMLKMQLIADKPLDDKRNYKIEEKGFGKEKQRYVMVPEKDFDDLARRANSGPLMQLLEDFKEHILGLGIVKRLRATIAKLKEEMAGLLRENDSLSKELTAVIEDRNKYRSQLLDQEYYLTDKERDEIAEKIIQRKDLELEDGDRDRAFERDDLDLSR
ncbi:recombinase [Streptococcus parasanguinis]|uniref:plasmid recombination protein n=1 Tax=Streptococcus parasanguinis TaxID=1318 RepID=UPI0010108110|nr:plasmid recombination protein [Streptococcus parasanguinis]RXX16448.1 recombinase [Streptococcus parasanguinis]